MIKKNKQNKKRYNIYTEEKISDAAEKLFAKKGIYAVSVRDITNNAKVNVGLIKYYFGSKTGLIKKVITRRIDIINKERLQLLEKVSQDKPKKSSKEKQIRNILYAFIFPPVNFAIKNPEYIEFIARVHIEADDKLQHFFVELFAEVLKKFTRALADVYKTKDSGKIYRKMFFLIGAMINLFKHKEIFQKKFKTGENINNSIDLTEQLIDFAIKGFSKL